MTRNGWGADAPSEELPRLDERVRDLLSGFPGAVAFQGLRRTLKVHPESLTRALRRLEREGAVERTGAGYRLAPTAVSGAPSRKGRGRAVPSTPAAERPRSPTWTTPPQVELRLSPGADPAQFLRRLSGHWFGSFRWVGSYQDGGASTLLWVSRSGSDLLGLELQGDLLRIHQQSMPVTNSTGVTPTSTSEPSSVAAYELLQHVLTAIRGSRPSTTLPAPPVLLMSAGEHGPDRPLARGIAG